MKCPNCSNEFRDKWTTLTIDHDSNGLLEIDYTKCTACEKLIVKLIQSELESEKRVTKSENVIYPSN